MKGHINDFADHAYCISRNGIVTIYQHAISLQVFKTVELASGALELIIMHQGVWVSEGTFTHNQISYQIANPK
jgi:hypothetical protein